MGFAALIGLTGLLGTGGAMAGPLVIPGTDVLPSVCLAGPKGGKDKRKLEIPAGGADDPVLRITWALDQGERGAAAVVTLSGPGWSQSHSATIGAELSATPISGPDLEPVTVERTGPMDRIRVEGSVWTLPLGGPLDRVVLEARGEARFCVYAVETGPERGLRLTGTDTATWAEASAVQGLGARAPGPSAPPTRVRLDDQGHLVDGGGRRARFWGVEIAGVPADDQIEPLIQRLSGLGFNLVRLINVDRNSAARSSPDGGRALDPALLARLDHLAAAAAARGVHLWVEGVATGGLASSPDSGLPDGWKLRPFWSAEAEASFTRQLQAMWDRDHAASGGRWLANPAVLAMTVSPDHSLVSRWGASLEGLPAPMLAELDARWNTWLKQHYTTEAAISAAWAAPVRGGLQPGEALASGTVRREPLFPQLAEGWPEARTRDLVRFYREIEAGFYDRVALTLAKLGPELLLAPTETRGRSTLLALHPRSAWTDVRVAWDALRNDRIEGESLIRRPESAIETLSAWKADAATVVEVRHPFPNPWRAEAPWVWAVLGAVQDADVVLWEDWGTGELGGEGLSADAATLLQMPGAARSFREGRIPAASGRWELPVSLAALEARGMASDWEPPLMTRDLGVMLSTRVRTRLFGLPNGSAGSAGDCRRWGAARAEPCPPPPAVQAWSGPSPLVGGIGWWTESRLLLVDQPGLQVRVGPPGEPAGPGVGIQRLSGLAVALDRWAAVALVEDPTTKRASIQVSARQENTDMRWALAGSLLRSPGRSPVRVEVPQGTLAFPWPGTPIVKQLDAQGRPGATLTATARPDGWWAIPATLGWIEVGS